MLPRLQSLDLSENLLGGSAPPPPPTSEGGEGGGEGGEGMPLEAWLRGLGLANPDPYP